MNELERYCTQDVQFAFRISRWMATDPECWNAIVATYIKEPHCFVRGAGRETVAYWVRDVTGKWFPPNRIRRCLMHAVSIGRAEVNYDGRFCTRFRIKRYLKKGDMDHLTGPEYTFADQETQ